ncbi:MAG: acyltransferase family protein, partial [Pseudomonadota bacterium]
FFKGRSVLLAAGSILALLAAAWWLIPSSFVALKFYSNPVILEFIWGMVLAFVWQQHRSLFSKINPPVLVGSILVGIALLFLSGREHNPFIAGIGAALIIAAALGFEHRGQVLTSKVSAFFGDISYSLYLIHFTYFIVAESILNQMGMLENVFAAVIGLIIAFLSACFLAWMSFRLVETPLAQLARSSSRKAA